MRRASVLDHLFWSQQKELKVTDPCSRAGPTLQIRWKVLLMTFPWSGGEVSTPPFSKRYIQCWVKLTQFLIVKGPPVKITQKNYCINGLHFMEMSLTHCSCFYGFWVLSCGSEQQQERSKNTGLSVAALMQQHRFTQYYRSSVRSRKLSWPGVLAGELSGQRSLCCDLVPLHPKYRKI